MQLFDPLDDKACRSFPQFYILCVKCLPTTNDDKKNIELESRYNTMFGGVRKKGITYNVCIGIFHKVKTKLFMI